MAELILIICPECEKSIKAPESVVGKKIRCKGCGETFAAKAPKAKEKPPAKAPKAKEKPAAKEKAPDKPKAEIEEEGGAYGVTHEYLGARCPACIEPMEDDQIVCLNCGFNIQTRSQPKRRKVKETTGGDWFFWLLPGILCALSVIIVMTLVILYCALVWPESFGDSWLQFLGWKALKVWAAIIGLFISFIAGRFAVKRLILNYTPPEVEEKWGEEEED